MKTTTHALRLAPLAAAAAVVAVCSAMAFPPSHAAAPAPYVHNARVAEYLQSQPHPATTHTTAGNATIADALGR